MLPSTTLNHKACAKYLPVLLCTADLAPALCTSHSTWHTSHSTPHSTLNTLHSTLHSPHSTLHTSHCTRHTPHLTLHTSQSAPHSTITLFTSHSSLHRMPVDATKYHVCQSKCTCTTLNNFKNITICDIPLQTGRSQRLGVDFWGFASRRVGCHKVPRLPREMHLHNLTHITFSDIPHTQWRHETKRAANTHPPPNPPTSTKKTRNLRWAFLRWAFGKKPESRNENRKPRSGN